MTVIEIHHCPRCDLRFTNLSEVEDHLYRDHGLDLTANPTTITVDSSSEIATTGRIVVPLDPSRPPSASPEVAVTVARQAAMSVELVAAAAPGLDEITTTSYLRAAARALDGADLSVTCTSLGAGDPAEDILRHVQPGGVSILCMDTHSRTAVSELVFGSVTQAVIRQTPVPVLVCGPHIEVADRYDRILVGLDGSQLAENALSSAVALARAMDADVELLSVFDPEVDLPSDLSETNYLRRMSMLSAVPIDAFDVLHEHDAGRALARAASGRARTILAVGTQGRTGFQRLRLGSVALSAVRHATCPVLLVPPSAQLQRS